MSLQSSALSTGKAYRIVRAGRAVPLTALSQDLKTDAKKA